MSVPAARSSSSSGSPDPGRSFLLRLLPVRAPRPEPALDDGQPLGDGQEVDPARAAVLSNVVIALLALATSALTISMKARTTVGKSGTCLSSSR